MRGESWWARDPDARRAEEARRAERASRRRWYVSLSVANSAYVDARGRTAYHRYVWPVLYRSERAAWDAIETLPVFAANPALPGRVRSATVCRTTVAPGR